VSEAGERVSTTIIDWLPPLYSHHAPATASAAPSDQAAGARAFQEVLPSSRRSNAAKWIKPGGGPIFVLGKVPSAISAQNPGGAEPAQGPTAPGPGRYGQAGRNGGARSVTFFGRPRRRAIFLLIGCVSAESVAVVGGDHGAVSFFALDREVTEAPLCEDEQPRRIILNTVEYSRNPTPRLSRMASAFLTISTVFRLSRPGDFGTVRAGELFRRAGLHCKARSPRCFKGGVPRPRHLCPWHRSRPSRMLLSRFCPLSWQRARTFLNPPTVIEGPRSRSCVHGRSISASALPPAFSG